MRTFGLIGFPLEHSYSPAHFAEKFYKEHHSDCRYEAFPLPSIEDFPALLAAETELAGLNVTIPYKEAVIPYLDRLDTTAQMIGAVNCIVISEAGLLGYNTDWLGFQSSLMNFVSGERVDSALVLGSGGSSKAVRFALDQMDIGCQVVSASGAEGSIAYAVLDAKTIRQHRLIINTTPLGMFPEVAASPSIPYEGIGKEHFLFDLIYNPEMTVFLLKGKKQGARIRNGLEMLYLQAEASWRLWNRGR